MNSTAMAVPPVELQDVRLLLVDDEQVILRFMQRVAEGLGVSQAIAVHTAEDALAWLEAQPTDMW